MSMLAHQDSTVIKSAATCLAAIAVIELPAQKWPDFLPLMCNTAQSNDINVRLASLHVIGFICEDINPKDLSDNDMSSILFAVLSNVVPDQIELTQIAIKAFARAAPITDKNFPAPEQRQFIMSKLFEAANINDEDVLSFLMEALNDIVRVNYDFMGEYIE